MWIVTLPWLPANAMAPAPGVVLLSWWHTRRLAPNRITAIVRHEMVHHRQQRRVGWLRFVWDWLTNPEARHRWEGEAEEVEAAALRALGEAAAN